VQGLLENLERISRAPISENEVAGARRFLSDVFAVRIETIGSIANLLAVQDALGLGDGYWDKYRDAVRAVQAARASTAATKLFAPEKSLIVIAGDASAIAKDVARFAPKNTVELVDPSKDFQTVSK